MALPRARGRWTQKIGGLCEEIGERAAAQKIRTSQTAMRRALKLGVAETSRSIRARLAHSEFGVKFSSNLMNLVRWCRPDLSCLARNARLSDAANRIAIRLFLPCRDCSQETGQGWSLTSPSFNPGGGQWTSFPPSAG